jgi:prepilin-type N-terminal cleavage/methylation domain-containing protein
MVKKGFTLIELMFAMGLLATMVLCVAVLAIRITTIYEKSFTIKEIGLLGKAIIDDVSRSIGVATVSSLGVEENYYFERKDSGGQPLYGAFCTGRYSYLWNTNQGSMASYIYWENDAEVKDDGFRLIRVVDSSRYICGQRLGTREIISVPCAHTDFYISVPDDTKDTDGGLYFGTPDDNYNTFYAPKENCTEKPVELISRSSVGIIRDFRVVSAVGGSGGSQVFYSMDFILATTRGDIDILSSGDYCSDISADLSTDFNYCAINKFYFSKMSGGKHDQ